MLAPGTKSARAAIVMSNAKVAEMIAQAQLQTADVIRMTLEPLVKDLAQLRAEIEQLQSAIAPMATDLERLRAEVRAMQGVGDTPK